MNKDNGKQIADIVCEAFNTLDSSFFEAILSDDFEYISVWMLETIKGKNRFMEYISGRFEFTSKGNNPISAKVLYQEVIDKYVVVLNQGEKIAAFEPTIVEGKLKSLWMRPIEMTLPAVFTTQKPCPAEKPKENLQETEYGKFSRLFIEALMSKHFDEVQELMADDLTQILYNKREFSGKNEVIAYWKDWLERWNEPAENTEYKVKFCKYYDRDVLSIYPRGERELYQIARFENGQVKQLILCPNPLQSPTIRYWDLDHSPLLFKDLTVMPHKMGDDLEPRPHRIPCMRCGCKSEKLQWYKYMHDAGPLGYKGELSVCTNCMEAVEFLPTILMRYQ